MTRDHDPKWSSCTPTRTVVRLLSRAGASWMRNATRKATPGAALRALSHDVG